MFRKLSYNIILFLCFYLPIEEFILSSIFGSSILRLIARQAPDVLIFSIIFMLLIENFIAKNLKIPFIGKGADKYLLFFIIIAIGLIIIRPVDKFAALLNLKTLLRYISLIYIILLIKPNHKEINKIIFVIMGAVFFQMLIGVSQYIGGPKVIHFFSPSNITDSSSQLTKIYTGLRTSYEGLNILVGTIGVEVSYGAFLLIGLSIWLVIKKRNILYYVIIITILVLIYFTKSRACILGSILVILLNEILQKGFSRLFFLLSISIITTIFLSPLITSFITSYKAINAEDKLNFIYMFTTDYISMSASHQRLGMIFYILPSMITNPDMLLGLGPDKSYVQNVFSSIKEIPYFMAYITIEDVYWLALIIYYGVIGALLFLLFIFSLIKISNQARLSNESFSKKLATLSLLLISVSCFLNFFNQAYELRQFSFYLWLIVGLMLNAKKRV